MTDFSEALKDHMDREEAFQEKVSDALQATAISLATTTATLKAIEERMIRHEADDRAIAQAVQHQDSRVDGHEARIAELEGSVRRAISAAKWFFGGGLLAACGSAWFLFQLAHSFGSILEKMPK